LADVPSWISASTGLAGLIVAGSAAFVGLRTYAHQRTSYDVNLALSIFAEINRYWDRATASEGATPYNYGQILAHFEIAAALFNDKVLTRQAAKILGDHIVEVFTALEGSENGRALLEHCQSSSETFKDLRKFAKTHFPKALLSQAFSDNRQLAKRSSEQEGR
jgi:hypothetical protein